MREQMFQLLKKGGGLFSTKRMQCHNLVLRIKTFMYHNVYGRHDMTSSTILNTDVCWYSWPSGNTQTHLLTQNLIHLPQVGAEIKVQRWRSHCGQLSHSHIGFCGLSFFVLPLTRILHPKVRNKGPT